MFYDFTKDNVPKGLFKSCIIPRPIAWVSSISNEGITNLAPFSYFQAVCDKPPMIMFINSPKMNGDMKDTARNIIETKEFVINLACETAKKEMSLSSNELEYGISEIDKYKIETISSKLISPHTISSSPISLECTLEKVIDIEKNKMIIGKVIGISVKDDIMIGQRIDTKKLKLLARLGWNQYTIVDNVITIDRMLGTEEKC